MFLQIDNFLTESEVRTVTELSLRTQFIEGRRTNPHHAAKTNVIADPADPAGQQASQIALAALQRSQEAREFVFPQRVAIPTLSRYEVGMTYGPHVDAAFLPVGQQPLRSDVSCTIFISNPGDYEGGELVVHQGSELIRLKGRAGSAVFYASTSIHQVMPVTAGQRLVVITFIESQIRDPMQRDLLFALGEVRALEAAKMDWRNRAQLDYVVENLHRMWSR